MQTTVTTEIQFIEFPIPVKLSVTSFGVVGFVDFSASEMTSIVSSGALNSTHSLVDFNTVCFALQLSYVHGRLGHLTAWHFPGGPVGSASRWATMSNVEVGQTTYPVNGVRVGECRDTTSQRRGQRMNE